MKVALLGDAHGSWTALNALLTRARDRLGVVAGIQVGDLGIDRATLQTFAQAQNRFAVPLHVIDGNHDDHAFLARATRQGHTREWSERQNLFFQPRPSLATVAGSVVGFLGGALHVVCAQRHGLFTGAPNYVQERQAKAAAELFNRARPMLIVTHSCPSGIGIGMRGHPDLAASLHENVVQAGFDPGPPNDRGEAALRLLWDQLRHKPKAWVFGHFHVDHRVQIEGTHFACVKAIAAEPASEVLCWDSETGRLCSHVLFACTRQRAAAEPRLGCKNGGRGPNETSS